MHLVLSAGLSAVLSAGFSAGLSAGLSAVLFALAAPPAPGVTFDESDKLIVPGKRIGPVESGSCHEDLKRLLGKENVKTTDVHIGEGETEPGTVVWPKLPYKRVEVLWWNGQELCKPKRIIVRGKASQWRTAEGIGLKNSLADLERINGKPFTLTGYEWDYGGTILAWNGGKLAQVFGECAKNDCPDDRVLIRLGSVDYAGKKISSKELQQIAGDHAFPSDHPVMKKLDPKVSEILVNLPQK